MKKIKKDFLKILIIPSFVISTMTFGAYGLVNSFESEVTIEDQNSASLIEGDKLKHIFSRSLNIVNSGIKTDIDTEEAMKIGVFDDYLNFVKYSDPKEANFNGVVRLGNVFGGSIDVDIKVGEGFKVTYTGVDSGEDCAVLLNSQKETGWSNVSIDDWDENFGGYAKQTLIDINEPSLDLKYFRSVCSAGAVRLTDIVFNKNI